MRKADWTSYLIVGFLLVSLVLGCAGTRKADQAMQLRIQRVQTTLTDIVRALQSYKQDKGYFPKGMATLRDAHYLSIMPDVERVWTLKHYTDGAVRWMMVEAVSKSSMPDGAGHRIIYRVPDQTWEGYGITEFP